jgi:hypothetical protein
VVFQGGEVEDGVLRDKGNLRVTSAPSIASRRRSRGRLETWAPRVIAGELDLLRIKINQGCQMMCREEGKGLGVEEEARLTGRCRIRPELSVGRQRSDEQFHCVAEELAAEEKGGEGGGVGGFIGGLAWREG